MKRFYFALVACLVVAVSYAEELRPDYYAPIEGLSDSLLKATLGEIIEGGERVEYGSNSYHTTTKAGEWEKGDFKAMGTWGAFALTDAKSDATVWDMYGSRRRYFPIRGQSAAGLEIEHCLPKSWWGGVDNAAYKDLYHLNPADAIANTNKSNYPPGNVIQADKFDNGSFRMGKNPAYAEYGNFYVFEPEDEYKGDFARAWFYVITAYASLDWSKAIVGCMQDDWHLFAPWLTEVLLEWHRKDPVSRKELMRQEAISSIQHNRNPYIDYPELVEYIWGNMQGRPVRLDELICTLTDDYECLPDRYDPVALPPTEVTATGFRAHWTDTDGRSLLEVYRKHESGQADTLLAMPIVKSDSVKSNPYVSWLKPDNTAATATTTDGGGAYYMATKTEKRAFVIEGLTIPVDANLIVKASVYNKGDSEATLVVETDGDTIALLPLSLDEDWYTVPLPAGCRRIALTQLHPGSENRRASLQQVFIIAGDYAYAEPALEGFPLETADCEVEVRPDWQPGDVLYYRIINESGQRSNEIAVRFPDQTALSETPCARLTLTEGRIVVQGARGVLLRLYDPAGRLYLETASASLQLPERGVWILRVGDESHKVVW